jgi:hypothetical protein
MWWSKDYHNFSRTYIQVLNHFRINSSGWLVCVIVNGSFEELNGNYAEVDYWLFEDNSRKNRNNMLFRCEQKRRKECIWRIQVINTYSCINSIRLWTLGKRYLVAF